MSETAELKPALTVDQQISLLEERGLVIGNKDDAKIFLIDNNYYRLNIYFHKTMDSIDHFPTSITFDQIVTIYKNDRFLRRLLLDFLEPFEIKMKTAVAYHLGCKYGANVFYDESICSNKHHYDEVFNNFKSEIHRNKDDSVVRHHQEKFGGKFPIWVVVEYLSLHTISKYYKNLMSVDKDTIADVTFNLPGIYLESWVYSLSIMRNICAHYGYLFRRLNSIALYGGSIFDWNNEDNRTLFSIFQVSRRLSTPSTWNPLFDKLIELENNNDQKLLKDYGFPEMWSDLLQYR